MTGLGSYLDPGDDFQETFWALLRYAYPPEQIVYVPSTMGGDLGIEGYTADGIAYQCFADRGSLNLSEQTRKQRAKMNEDTLKLQKNVEQLQLLFGQLKIKHWFLVVPKYDSAELVVYASQRASVVRSWNLPFIDSSFEIRIKTLADYHQQARQLVRDGLGQVSLTAEVDDAEIALFPTTKPELARVLEDKLVAVAASPDEVVLLRDTFIKAYLAKEKVLQALRDWPELLQAVETRRTLQERKLELESSLSPEAPNRRVLDLYRDYQSDLLNEAIGLHETDAERLAYGQIGDWLMRCPLRFRVAV